MNTCRSLGSVPVPQIGYQKLGTLIDWDNPVFFFGNVSLNGLVFLGTSAGNNRFSHGKYGAFL